jgi:hypothetical protein
MGCCSSKWAVQVEANFSPIGTGDPSAFAQKQPSAEELAFGRLQTSIKYQTHKWKVFTCHMCLACRKVAGRHQRDRKCPKCVGAKKDIVMEGEGAQSTPCVSAYSSICNFCINRMYVTKLKHKKALASDLYNWAVCGLCGVEETQQSKEATNSKPILQKISVCLACATRCALGPQCRAPSAFSKELWCVRCEGPVRDCIARQTGHSISKYACRPLSLPESVNREASTFVPHHYNGETKTNTHTHTHTHTHVHSVA